MALKNIESIYPLSPMQESMLFYAQSRITAKQAGLDNSLLTDDVLFNQTNIDITGNILLSEFQQAWQQVAIDNSAFRTGFLWEGLKQAQQFVRKQVELPFTFTDLSTETTKQQKNTLNEITLADVKQGFDLNKAPLMRVHLIKLSNNTYRLIWSCHHLIVDRWCIPIVFEKLAQYYDALTQKHPLPITKAPPFKRYIAWHHKQPAEKSEQYWSTNLANFSQSSRLCKSAASAPQMKFEHLIDAALIEQVKQFCRSNKITLASLFQSVWSLTLNQLLGLQDIIYGLVVSGRPAQIPDVENIIGTFVNNVPVRQALPSQINILQWLKQNQSQGFQRIDHDHESAIKLHNFTQLQADHPLFDHVLVWQNTATLANSQFLNMSPLPGKLNTAYPLTISIEEKESGLQLAAMVNSGWQLLFQDRLFDVLESLLLQLVSVSTNQKLQDLKGFMLSDTFQASQSIEKQPIQPIEISAAKTPEEIMKGRTSLSKEVVEEFLTREWKSILELDVIGLDDDFFVLGGNSLKAAQLVARLEQAEKKHIPIIQLFAGRTIRSMTEIYLTSDWSIKPGWVTPVNTKGKGKPIFYIASPEVNVIGYAQLAHELGADISGYIVQPPPQSEHIRQIRTKDIPAISLEYIDKIQQIQASGPYHIIGMCSGAQISAEIVRQMEHQSIPVGYFGILNTWSLYSISKLYHFEKVINFYRMLRYYLKRIFSLQWSEVRNRFLPVIKSKTLPKSFAQTEAENKQLFTPPERQYDETLEPVKEAKWASERPVDIQKIKHPMTVFRIKSKPYWRIRSDELGWNYLTEQVKVIQLKETVHEAILREPHIAHFASQLREELLNSKQ